MKAFYIIIPVIFMLSCRNSTIQDSASAQAVVSPSAVSIGQSSVEDNESMKDVVKVAVGSPDHTTLVKALQQAELVNALSNAGPFTVFAPVNEAFSKLPPGTLDKLSKPERKADLQNILEYHVTTSALKASFFKNGMTLGMVNGDHIDIRVTNGKISINNSANILASIPASNGIIHVIDAVLLPPGN